MLVYQRVYQGGSFVMGDSTAEGCPGGLNSWKTSRPMEAFFPLMWMLGRDLFHLQKKVRLLTNGGLPSIALGHPSPYSEIQTSIGIFLPSFGDDWCFCQFFMIYGNAASNLNPHGQAAMGWKLNLEGFLQSKGRVRRPPIPDGQEGEVVRNAKNKQWRLWNLLPASDDIHICVHTQMYD